MSKQRVDEEDRFLREGLTHFVPAVCSLNEFVRRVESRIRAAVKPHDRELEGLGLVTSRGKLKAPSLTELTECLQIQVSSPNSSFYLYFDAESEPARSMSVGFWLWLPTAADRRETYALLEPLWATAGLVVTERGILEGDLYLDPEADFPNFEKRLDWLVCEVIASLNKIEFSKRFGQAFRKKSSSSVE